MPTRSKSSAGPGLLSDKEVANGFKHIKEQSPKFTMRPKPASSFLGSPSSANAPGPQYKYNLDLFKPKAPVFTFARSSSAPARKKADLGANFLSPSQVSTVDGKNPTLTRPRCFKMGGKLPGEIDLMAVRSPGPVYGDAAIDLKKQELIDSTRRRSPAYSMGSSPSGESIFVPNKRSPGPIYQTNDMKRQEAVDSTFRRTPAASIGVKLPTEADLMSVRSPGPIYGGSAVDVNLQANVDSTKRGASRTSLGNGPRWDGPTFDLIQQGQIGRYEHGKFAGPPADNDDLQATQSGRQDNQDHETGDG